MFVPYDKRNSLIQFVSDHGRYRMFERNETADKHACKGSATPDYTVFRTIRKSFANVYTHIYRIQVNTKRQTTDCRLSCGRVASHLSCCISTCYTVYRNETWF